MDEREQEVDIDYIQRMFDEVRSEIRQIVDDSNNSGFSKERQIEWKVESGWSWSKKSILDE